MSSVLKCIEELQELKSIDVLINNAGIMALPIQTFTSDGYEKHMAVNHLGHFLLTNGIFNLLEKNSRIINISSAAHTIGKLNNQMSLLENMKSQDYNPWIAYGSSKLANILFTKALAKRYSNIISLTCHPGIL